MLTVRNSNAGVVADRVKTSRSGGERLVEQRMNVRVPVELSVSVHYAGRGAGPRRMEGTVRNLSFDGALIEAGEAPPEKGLPVRVELHANPHGPVTVDALVLRHDGRGLGLMFAHYDDAAFEKLAGMLAPELDKQFRARR